MYLWNVYNVHRSSSCDEKLTGNACIDLCFKIITFHNSKDNNGEDCFLLSRASSSLPYIQKVLNVCKDCFSLKSFHSHNMRKIQSYFRSLVFRDFLDVCSLPSPGIVGRIQSRFFGSRRFGNWVIFKIWTQTSKKGLESPNSAELWSPDSVSCSLPPPSRDMWTPSVNVLGGSPLACYMVENWGTWQR